MGISFQAQDRHFRDAVCIDCKGEYETSPGVYCETCPRYGFFPATGDLSVDMSTGRASHVLGMLGLALSDDYVTVLDPADVLTRIAIIRQYQLVEFSTDTVVDGNAVYCGYDVEYLARRLNDLAALCHYALEEGVTIYGA